MLRLLHVSVCFGWGQQTLALCNHFCIIFPSMQLAVVSLLHDPLLQGSGLMESFVQGVLDCRDEDEITHFLQLAAKCPADRPAGDLNASDVRRRLEDKSRLTELLEQTLDAEMLDDEDVDALLGKTKIETDAEESD